MSVVLWNSILQFGVLTEITNIMSHRKSPPLQSPSDYEVVFNNTTILAVTLPVLDRTRKKRKYIINRMLPREDVAVLSLELFKARFDGALGNLV